MNANVGFGTFDIQYINWVEAIKLKFSPKQY